MFFYRIRSLCVRGGHCTYYANMYIEKHTPHVLYFIHDEPNGTAGREGGNGLFTGCNGKRLRRRVLVVKNKTKTNKIKNDANKRACLDGKRIVHMIVFFECATPMRVTRRIIWYDRKTHIHAFGHQRSQGVCRSSRNNVNVARLFAVRTSE